MPPPVAEKPLTAIPGMAEVIREVALRISQEEISLFEFVKAVWPIVEPGQEFESKDFIELICEELEAVTFGFQNRLIFNLPPRYGKSLLVTVIWPVWEWTMFPERRFLFFSYAQSLSVKHSLDRRAIISSDYYQKRWGHLVKLAIDQNQKTEFQNTARGHMIASSFGGTAIGKGGSRIILDDPMDPNQAESEALREAATNFYDKNVSTRLDDKKVDAIIIVAQRLHENDLCGHVQGREPKRWKVISLPGIAPEPTKKSPGGISLTFPISGRVLLRKAGEALWEWKENLETLAQVSLGMGSRGFAAQWLQAPKDPKGNMIKRDWFGYYRELPKSIFKVWSWDTAHKKGQQNSYSVGILFSESDDYFDIVDVVRDKMEFPELKRRVKQGWDAKPSAAVIVEEKASGTPLVQEIKRGTKMPVKGIKVDSDKAVRLSLVSPSIEAGKVRLPEGAPWVQDFLDEVCGFPNAAHDDQTDAMSQGLQYLKTRPKKKVLSFGRK